MLPVLLVEDGDPLVGVANPESQVRHMPEGEGGWNGMGKLAEVGL